MSSRSLASDVYALRPANLTNMDDLDQDYADTVVQNRSYSRCALGPAFAAACWRKRIPASAREACGFVTYHTNCITNMRDKLHAMKRVLEVTRGCGNATGAAAANGSAAYAAGSSSSLHTRGQLLQR